MIFIAPGFVLGRDFAGSFWRIGWPLALILTLVLAGLDVFFVLNHRLYYLLEREDWPALIQYLETRLFRKGHYTSRLVQLLANTYLVLSDSPAVISLENKVAIVKPALVHANALVFGAARILDKDYAGAARFFETHVEATGDKRGRDAEWLRWYQGFALLLDHQYQQAAERFLVIAETSPNPLPTALSAYFLTEPLGKALYTRRGELNLAAENGRNRIKAALPKRAAWERDIAKLQNEVHVAILTKYIADTSNWLYR